MFHLRKFSAAVTLATLLCSSQNRMFAADELGTSDRKPSLSIAELKRSSTVDFEKEILPILKNNCLACHNQTKAKADFVLETPQTILKGGESGPAIIPGNSSESLLFKLASHQDKPVMPPKDNKVNASDLTPEQLGLVKLWIDQGAKGEVHGQTPIVWQPLPPNVNPIFAVALTSDGQFAACGRGNQLHLYHIPTRQLAARLIDPELGRTGTYTNCGAAHLDLVHALAFNPAGDLLASGGYREVKLWRRTRGKPKLSLANVHSNAVAALAATLDGKWFASGGDDGVVKVWNAVSGDCTQTLTGHEKSITSLKFSPDGTKIVYRAWHPTDPTELKTYRDLLKQHMIRPNRMELFVMNADGRGQQQITTLGGANFGPSWTHDGKRVIFSSNHKNPRSRNFDLYIVNIDGTGLSQITTNPEFDGFPTFSPDGRKLIWASNRNDAKAGETNLFIADWKD
jgi:WD40 repeat protein